MELFVRVVEGRVRRAAGWERLEVAELREEVGARVEKLRPLRRGHGGAGDGGVRVEGREGEVAHLCASRFNSPHKRWRVGTFQSDWYRAS